LTYSTKSENIPFRSIQRRFIVYNDKKQESRMRISGMFLAIPLLVISAAAQTAPSTKAPALGKSDPSFSAPSLAPGVDYTLPTEAEIKSKLDAVLDRFVRLTHYEVIDTETRKPITDFTTVRKTAGIDDTEYVDWTYTMGVVHSGMLQVSDVTGDTRYRDYTLKGFDFIFDHLGYFQQQAKQFGPQPRGYRRLLDMHELDDCGSIGAALIRAYSLKKDPRYRAAIDKADDHIARRQLRLANGTLARPRPQPVSVWGDDAYMSIPFLARMGTLTGDRKYYDDAVQQVLGMNEALRDPVTGFLAHAWFQNTPYSPRFFWARANAWVLMATTELLSELPENHPAREKILDAYRRQVFAITGAQSGNGMWHQLLDKSDSYLETSATAMFTYSIARGVNRGWLSPVYAPVAQTGWQAVATQIKANGDVEGTCIGTTAAYDAVYYYNRPAEAAAMHGYGPVLLAGSEVITMLRSFDIERKLNTFHYRARTKQTQDKTK
jgi:rhamnogalacturonyl hydrolase YesR